MELTATCLCGGAAHPLIQDGRHTAFVFKDQISRIHVCASCSHVFFSPKPSEQELAEHYNGSWNEGSGYSIDFCYEAWVSKIDSPIHKPKATFVKLIRDLRAKHFSRSARVTVHDAGCGYGALVSKLNLLGFQASGSDIDQASIDLGKARGTPNLWCCHYRDIPRLLPEAVDIVTCYHSLEHYPDPLDFFAAVKRALRPGGLFIMAVPNGAYLPARTDYFGKYDWCFYPGHLQYFTPDSARPLLASEGLRVLDAVSYDWDGTQEDWLLDTAAQFREFAAVPRQKLLDHLGRRGLTRDLRVVAIHRGEHRRNLIRNAVAGIRQRLSAPAEPAVFSPAKRKSPSVIAAARCEAIADAGIRVTGYEVSRRNQEDILSLHWIADRKLENEYIVVLHVQNYPSSGDEFVNLDFPPWPPTSQWKPGEPVTVRRQLSGPRIIEWRPGEARNLVHERPFPPGKYILRVGLWDLNRGLIGNLVSLGPITLLDAGG